MKVERYEDPCGQCEIKCNKPQFFKPMPGKGKKGAKILVVTKAPRKGQAHPLSPQALAFFSKYMKDHGFGPADFIFHSAVRCEYDPSIYRVQQKHSITKSCREWLHRRIETMKPDLIIPLGNDAATAVMGRKVAIMKARGTPVHHEGHDAYVLPMLDPEFVSMYPQHKASFNVDCRTMRQLIDENYDVDKIGKDTLGKYQIVDDLQFLIDRKPKYLDFDIECVGLRHSARGAKICTMQFCTAPGEAYAVVWDHPERPFPRNKRKKFLNQLRTLFGNPDTEIIGQNLKFDAVWILKKFGIRFRIYHDTLMYYTLLDENSTDKSQDMLVKRYVPEMAGYADAFNNKYDKGRMDLIPLDDLVNYGCGDVDSNFRLFLKLKAEVDKDSKLLSHYHYVSRPALNAFVPVEAEGMLVSEANLDAFQVTLAKSVEEQRMSVIGQVDRGITQKWMRLHGKTGLNLGRRDFLRDILFEPPYGNARGCRLTPQVWTKTTEKLDSEFKLPSTSTKDHLPFFFDHPQHGRFCMDLAQLLKDERLYSTNVVSFRKKYMIDGRIYPTYSLTTAVTGRSACLREDALVTTLRGPVRADSVEIGDLVWTHQGRWQKVEKLFLKTEEQMYTIKFSSGEEVTVTGGHRFLCSDGKWRELEVLRDALDIQEGQDGSGLVPLRSGRQVQDASRSPVRGNQDRREETPEGTDMGLRVRGWEWVLDPASGREGSPDDPRTLPSGYRDYEIEEIVCAGVHPVYDFQVAIDQSYLADGVFSHNSRDPNGQNFPKRGKNAKAYRAIFVPPPGCVLLEADLSQAELRIAADMANEQTMLGIYRKNGDIHKATACMAMGITMEEFSKLPKEEQKLARYKAKAINFGYIYGMGWRKFIIYAKTQYGIDYTDREAETIRNGYFEMFYNLPQWHKTIRNYAKQHKQVRSYSGRVRHLPMIDSHEEYIQAEAQRQAINSPVQEFGSSLGLMSMGRIDQEIDRKYLKLIGFVHDALYAYVPAKYVEWASKVLKHYMETNPIYDWFGIDMACPVVSEVGFGYDGSSMFELDNLKLGKKYHWKEEIYDTKDWRAANVAELPTQKRPPNDGRIETPDHLFLDIEV